MMTTLTDLAGVLTRWTLALALVTVTTWCAAASALNGAAVSMTAWIVVGVPLSCAALWHAHKHTLQVLRVRRARWVQPPAAVEPERVPVTGIEDLRTRWLADQPSMSAEQLRERVAAVTPVPASRGRRLSLAPALTEVDVTALAASVGVMRQARHAVDTPTSVVSAVRR